MNRKQIKQNRLFNHFKSYIPDKIFGSDLREIINYNPDLYRDLFLKYQSYGRKSLSSIELENIKPLVDAQSLKEITINSIIMETFEWDSRGWGWIYPINNILSSKLDRLTKLSLLRIKKRLYGENELLTFADRLIFYISHPISKLWPSEFNKNLCRFKSHYKI